MPDPWRKRVELCGGRAVCYLGDCLEILPTLAENSVDAILTDPPYGLEFMGKDWDHGVPGVPFWAAALRVAKPGAMLLAFGGTRTHHRLACGIEDAGWEIRDCIMWVYGSGFPKSLDISKAIDKAAGAEREVLGKRVTGAAYTRAARRNANQGFESGQTECSITAPATDLARLWQGWGTALKPAWEIIIVAMKPLDGTFAANAEKWGVAGLNVDGCRVAGDVPITGQGTSDRIYGGGSGLRPEELGIQDFHPHPSGRWPSNLVHDGSEEVVGLFPQTGPAKSAPRGSVQRFDPADDSAKRPKGGNETRGHDDSGGTAARFFACCPRDEIELLFCRAESIMRAWSLSQGEEPCSSDANTVSESSPLPSQAVVSVLNDVVIAASRGDRLLSGAEGLSTTVTEQECERLCETLIVAILSSENGRSLGPLRDVPIPNGCRVSVAEVQKQTGITTITISHWKSGGGADDATFDIMPLSPEVGAGGLASRFRYCPKASRAERGEGNKHPTVKPLALMEWLCRLVSTPTGGLVLDPFMGSCTTGLACMKNGQKFIGIEKDVESFETACERIAKTPVALTGDQAKDAKVKRTAFF